jgi:hypothetical protein
LLAAFCPASDTTAADDLIHAAQHVLRRLQADAIAVTAHAMQLTLCTFRWWIGAAVIVLHSDHFVNLLLSNAHM